MTANPPGYELHQEAQGRCQLALVGDWLEGMGAPTFDALAPALAKLTAQSLALDLSAVGRWDSLLPAFLLRCQAYCAERELELATTAVPPGLEDLLKLATAVPAQAKPDATGGGLFSLPRIRQSLHEIGEETQDSLAFIGDAAIACARAAAPSSATRWVDLRQFCFECGPNALPIITLTSVLVGMILAYLGAVQLQQFGAGIYVADLVAIGMLREMGALMTAVVMAGRTGAAYAAQLGTMQGNEEIDAIVTLGLSPMQFLVAPRIIALMLMMPLLTIYADALGIVGGSIVAGALGVSPLQYTSQLATALSMTHFLVGLGKSLLFATLIAIAGCRAGINAGRSSAAVGEATTEAVVTAVVYLIVADAGMNILFQQLDI